MTTHGQGAGSSHSVFAPPGHAAVPSFTVYVGPQPVASSSRTLGLSGSQSSAWFWLPPPATLSETIGSLTLEAFSRLGLRPSVTTRSWEEPCWKEFAPG